MSRITDQKQMDAILEVVSPKFRKYFIEETKCQKKQYIQSYNFKHRNQLSKDTRRILERIHDHFASELAIFLLNKLRTNVKIKKNSIKQFTVEEFEKQLQFPTSIYLLNLQPQKRNIIFNYHHSFSFFVIDRLLGGPGSTNYKSRELTRIEQNILRNITGDIKTIFQSAWSKTVKFDLSIQNYYSRGDHLQFVRRGDNLISVSFQLHLDEETALNDVFTVTYPFMLISELFPGIMLEDSEPLNKSSKKERSVLSDNIKKIVAPVSLSLGQSHLSVDELSKLQVGDVVLLDRRPQDNLALNVGENTVFKGRAGLLKNKLAFRITQKSSK